MRHTRPQVCIIPTASVHKTLVWTHVLLEDFRRQSCSLPRSSNPRSISLAILVPSVFTNHNSCTREDHKTRATRSRYDAPRKGRRRSGSKQCVQRKCSLQSAVGGATDTDTVRIYRHSWHTSEEPVIRRERRWQSCANCRDDDFTVRRPPDVICR